VMNQHSRVFKLCYLAQNYQHIFLVDFEISQKAVFWGNNRYHKIFMN
jgi:hypothetical protein